MSVICAISKWKTGRTFWKKNRDGIPEGISEGVAVGNSEETFVRFSGKPGDSEEIKKQYMQDFLEEF